MTNKFAGGAVKSILGNILRKEDSSFSGCDWNALVKLMQNKYKFSLASKGIVIADDTFGINKNINLTSYKFNSSELANDVILLLKKLNADGLIIEEKGEIVKIKFNSNWIIEKKLLDSTWQNSQEYFRHGSRWSLGEREFVRRLFVNWYPISFISRRVSRPESSIEACLVKIGEMLDFGKHEWPKGKLVDIYDEDHEHIVDYCRESYWNDFHFSGHATGMIRCDCVEKLIDAGIVTGYKAEYLKSFIKTVDPDFLLDLNEIIQDAESLQLFVAFLLDSDQEDHWSSAVDILLLNNKYIEAFYVVRQIGNVDYAYQVLKNFQSHFVDLQIHQSKLLIRPNKI